MASHHTITVVHASEIDQLFDAVAEATEEAIYNSLFRATTVRGRDGNVGQALPLEDVKRILKNYERGNRQEKAGAAGAVGRALRSDPSARNAQGITNRGKWNHFRPQRPASNPSSAA